jgi:hypothetical protein
MSPKQPFAYATDKSSFIFSIRPTLAAALQAARERFRPPSFLIGITAWFEDGSSVELPWEELIVRNHQGNETDWISDEAATALQVRLFPPEDREASGTP